jgi:DNA-3-methyladenine glycosylase I
VSTPQVEPVRCSWASGGDPLYTTYHDEEWGVPLHDERALFELLCLEGAQAGLAWITILRKREGYRRAFLDFDPERAAELSDGDLEERLGDPGIVRNRLKVAAVIDNARVIQGLRRSHGSFHSWLEAHHPLPLEEWTRLFRRTFRFTGGLIVGEFLMSLGYLPGAHVPDCPVYGRIVPLAPPWSRALQPPTSN